MGWQFANFISTETSTTLRIEADLTATTFDYQKWTVIGVWNVCTLLDNDGSGAQNARFLQLEREFQRYNQNILGLREVKWWDPEESDGYRMTRSLDLGAGF